MRGLEVKTIMHSFEEITIDTNVCWVYKEDGDGDIKVKNDNSYRRLAGKYREGLIEEAKSAYGDDGNRTCIELTRTIQAGLHRKYPSIVFIGSNDVVPDTLCWRSLRDGGVNDDIMGSVVDMFVCVDIMKALQ